MLDDATLAYYFSLTHELPNVEFKGAGKGREKPLFGRVVRAAMGMANRRNGGTIIIGVADLNTDMRFDGLTPEQLATWKYEDIASGFNSYSSTPIEFERQLYEHNGKTFLILSIHEFATVPVMCIKDYPDPANPAKFILRPGAFYVRTLNKPESKEMLEHEEIRTLFDLANNKAIQTFVTHTRLAGINIAPAPTDTERFAEQLKGWTAPGLDKIRSRGYWDIRIHPVAFRQDRLPLSDLQQLLMRSAVNYRRWEFPITLELPAISNDWIGAENEFENLLQSWRFFQSGQLAAVASLIDDWDENVRYYTSLASAPNTVVSIGDVIFRFTEVFGLAARLATTEIYRDEQSIGIEVNLCNVQDRKLYARGIHLTAPMQGYKTKASTISYAPAPFLKEDVIARWQELAREAARYIFERFGWNASDQLLTTQQAELYIPQ